LIVSTSHRVCTIKNIDFTDFFNVFLSGATIWEALFSWDLRRRLLFHLLWTTGQNRRNLSNTVPEGLMSSEKAFLCCGKKSLDS